MDPGEDLDTLLAQAGLEPSELMIWARARVEDLLAALDPEGDELARLLEPGVEIDLSRASAAAPGTERVESEPESELDRVESETTLVDEDMATDATRGRGRRREPSTPQPLSAAELPPPPEHTGFADGEPEPMLETVDTGPIELGSPEADALISATSTREPESGGFDVDVDVDLGEDGAEPAPADAELTSEAEAEPTSEAEADAAVEDPGAIAPAEAEPTSEAEADAAVEDPSEVAAAEGQGADESEEDDDDQDDDDEEFDELDLDFVEIEEVELLEEVDEGNSAGPPPPPPGGGPPPPPPGGGPPPPPSSEPVSEPEPEDSFDIDMD